MEEIYSLIYIMFIMQFSAFVILLLISVLPDFYLIYKLDKKNDRIYNLNNAIHATKEDIQYINEDVEQLRNEIKDNG